MITWRPFVLAYLEHMRVTGFAARTLENTAWWLKVWLPWCVRRGLNAPAEVTAADVEAYQQYIRALPGRNGEQRSVSSVEQAMTVVRSLFAWAERREHVLFSPAADVAIVHAHHEVLVKLTIDDVRRLLEAADDGTLQGLRDRAVLETFYGTGIRRSELRGLKINDLDLVDRKLRIMGKGAVERFAPVGDNLAEVLERYLHDCRAQWVGRTGEPALFVTGLGTHFSESGLGALMERASARARLHVTAHMLRHAFAQHLLECGADIYDVSHLLGHRSMQSTEIYAQVMRDVMARKFRACHARGRRITKRPPRDKGADR